jgi:anthranilate phosphoribosyltransferase
MIDYIKTAVSGANLTLDQTKAAVDAIMSGGATPAQVGALLVALAVKGEHADEIAGAAQAMRGHAVRVQSARHPIVDVCGTGGDASGTFNISTAVAFVVAGAGVAVAKHGNRAMSSRCGSADVLEALGVRVDTPPHEAEAALDEDGIAFLFAQAYHPAMRLVAPIRREIGVRTLFNVIGPLSNPAAAHRQIVGVPRTELLALVAGAFARLGSERAAAIAGFGGLDEIGLNGPSSVAEWTGEKVVQYEIEPRTLGFSRRSLEEIAGGDARRNASIIRAILTGEDGAAREVVLINAGFALFIAGAAASVAAGVAAARVSIDTGAAQEKLAALIRRFPR